MSDEQLKSRDNKDNHSFCQPYPGCVTQWIDEKDQNPQLAKSFQPAHDQLTKVSVRTKFQEVTATAGVRRIPTISSLLRVLCVIPGTSLRTAAAQKPDKSRSRWMRQNPDNKPASFSASADINEYTPLVKLRPIAKGIYRGLVTCSKELRTNLAPIKFKDFQMFTISDS
ncbi:hypothetical protein OS493_004758 [Desmophyllum pertusum]|uniref:Uncharacterized protein n=1 Tax=Desmophyllum pertusum TaxID=174260 RepID=A0A9W9ZJL1_9CNID|nr:hypothetical protein OS493_004758 [Desmophyllum pertusum]